MSKTHAPARRRGMAPLVAALALATLIACGSKDAEPPPAAAEPAPAAEPPPAAEPEPAPKPEPAKAALTDRIDDPTFELKLVPSGPYAKGKLGSFGVSLVPKGVYHVNQEFPMTIAVTAAEGVELPKANLVKDDAAEFDEKKARFDVPFTATEAGSRRVECKVNFAVCTPETCVPDERTLALAFPVE